MEIYIFIKYNFCRISDIADMGCRNPSKLSATT